MRNEKLTEFRSLVKAAHDAVDEYAEARIAAGTGWHERDMDGKARKAIEDLFEYGTIVRPAVPSTSDFDNLGRT